MVLDMIKEVFIIGKQLLWMTVYNGLSHLSLYFSLSYTISYFRMGLLFIICLNQSFNALGGVVNSFPKEKIIVNRYC